MGRYPKYGVESAHYILIGLKLNVANRESLKQLSTIRDFIRWASSEFCRHELIFGNGFATALDEAKYLTLHTLSLPFDWPDSYLDCVLTTPEREAGFDRRR